MHNISIIIPYLSDDFKPFCANLQSLQIRHIVIAQGGDDGIVLKNSKSLGKQAMMENVTVRDCKVTSCTNAFKIGTETSYDISGVTVENCEFFMDDIYPSGVSGISIESADGAKVEHVEIRNIQMRGVACPLFVRLNNRNRDRDFDNTGAIQNVKVEALTADGMEIPVIITGTKDLTVQNITLTDFNLQYAPGEDYYDYRPFVPYLPRMQPYAEFKRLWAVRTVCGKCKVRELYGHPA